MFRLFRKQPKRIGVERRIQTKVAGILTKSIQKAKIRFATGLSRYESRLSVRGKKRALLIFCLSMGSFSGYWLYEGIFSNDQGKPTFLQHQSITRPKNTALPDSLNIKRLQEYKRWQVMKDSLPDSLKR